MIESMNNPEEDLVEVTTEETVDAPADFLIRDWPELDLSVVLDAAYQNIPGAAEELQRREEAGDFD
jgi:hypothetical protein